MIIAIYQGVEVQGQWFSMGDFLWLELSPESAKKVGTDAVLEKNLDKILDVKSVSSNNVVDVKISKNVEEEKVRQVG